MSEAENLKEFFTQFPQVDFPKNHVILAQGSRSDFFYLIEEGAVKLSRTSEGGRSLVFHIFFPGSFFSLLSLTSNSTNEFDFTTLIPTTVRKAPQSEVINFLKEHPTELFDLQQRLLKGMNGLITRIEHATLMPAIEQIAHLLLYFGKHFSQTNQEGVAKMALTITHQEIADWLGLSRENVSINMKKLEELGYIETKERLIYLLQPTSLDTIKQSDLDHSKMQ